MKRYRSEGTVSPTSLWLIRGLLLAAVLFVFGQTAGHEFLFFDDKGYVYQNPWVVPGLTWGGISAAFTQTVGANWHPLTVLSHMLDCELFGLNPAGHHLGNVLWHALAAILLFQVFWKLSGALWRSALLAMIFAIHPLRAESVAWVAERKDLLSGVFFFLTLAAYLAYVRRPFSWRSYLTVVVVFGLGLMTKPMLVTLPLVLLLLDYWPLDRFEASSRTALFLILEKIPFLALSAASSLATLFAQGSATMPAALAPFSLRFENALLSYVIYLRKFFCPLDLALLYPYPTESPPLWKVMAALCFLVGVTIAVFRRRRREPYLLVGWLWYLIMLIPVVGLVQVGVQGMADRYTYLPQIGLSVLIIWGIRDGLDRWTSHRSAYAATLSLALIPLMIVARQQTAYWINGKTLWTRSLEVTSGNYVAHSQLGIALMSEGAVDEAMDHYRQALEFNPTYVDAQNNLAISLAMRGQLDEAIALFRRALELSPRFAEGHYNLGQALQTQGHLRQAVEEFEKALEINPGYGRAREALRRVAEEKRQSVSAAPGES